MPVQFICPECRKLLAAGSRKVGSVVHCPKCQQPVRVPTPEEAAAAVALYHAQRQAPEPEVSFPEFAVFDSIGPEPDHAEAQPAVPPVATGPTQGAAASPAAEPPVAVATAVPEAATAAAMQLTAVAATVPPIQPASGSGAVVESGGRVARTEPAPAGGPNGAAHLAGNGAGRLADIYVQPTPPRPPTLMRLALSPGGGQGPLLAVSRGVLYFQAILFLVVGLVFFGVGYLVGYGTMPEGEYDPSGKLLPRITVEGRVMQTVANGQVQPEAGAVVLVLPEGKYPEPKLPVQGLRAGDAPPAEGAQLLLALEDLGGAYRRTGADGSYSLEVPKPGKYYICILSRQVERSSKQQPLEIELALMDRYFASSKELVGKHLYIWRLEEMLESPFKKSHNFAKN